MKRYQYPFQSHYITIEGVRIHVTARIDARPVIEGMPNARLVVVKDAGRYLQEDQPEEVARNILEFLDENEPSLTSAPHVSTDG